MGGGGDKKTYPNLRNWIVSGGHVHFLYSSVFMTKKLIVRIEQSTAKGFSFLASFKFIRFTSLKLIVITKCER
jgi:hypothetical protein